MSGFVAHFRVDCPECHGEGGHYEERGFFSRWHIDPPCEFFVPCEACDGHGEIVTDTPPFVGIEDLYERCGDYHAD